MYGAFKIDIAGRMTKFVKGTKEGFSLKNERIHIGRHRLNLQAEEEKQRVSERALHLEVEYGSALGFGA